MGGRPIVQSGFGASTIGGYGGFGGYGLGGVRSFGGYPAVGGFGGSNAAALALDAADGRIDGTSFGRPIVQSGAGAYAAPTFGGFGAGVPVASSFGGYPTSTFGGYGGLGGLATVGRAVF